MSLTIFLSIGIQDSIKDYFRKEWFMLATLDSKFNYGGFCSVPNSTRANIGKVLVRIRSDDVE